MSMRSFAESKSRKAVIIFGLAIILLATLLNPHIIEKIFGFGGKLEGSRLAGVLAIEVLLILIGSIIIIFSAFISRRIKEFLLLAVTFLLITPLGLSLLLHFYEFGWEDLTGPDTLFHHRLIPNAHFKVIYPDYTELEPLLLRDIEGRAIISKRTNSLGFADEEPEEKKTKTRILLLGDSFTEGIVFEWNFADMLEQKLNADADRFEVINMGASSYSPTIEYNVFRHKGLALLPDIIILNFDMTDVGNDFHYSHLLSATGTDDYIFTYRTPALLSSGIGAATYDKLQLLFSIFKARVIAIKGLVSRPQDTDAEVSIKAKLEERRRIAGMIRSQTTYAYAYTNESEFREHLNFTLGYIARMNDLAKRNNITFIIHSYPHAPQIFLGYDCYREISGLEKKKLYSTLIFSELASFSRTHNITLWLSNEAIRSSPTPPYFPCDMHFNQQGQDIIAEFLFSKLSKGNLPKERFFQT